MASLDVSNDHRCRSMRTCEPLITPAALLKALPITDPLTQAIGQVRRSIGRIMEAQDHRLLLVLGPCSIHDIPSALTYATRLKSMINRYGDDLCIVMRLYFEKPRTQKGWKGLLYQPDLNHEFQINRGLSMARSLLIAVNELGVPAGTEFLDTHIPAYLSDLIAWSAIGARTVESPLHRVLASSLSMPVGFKNTTGGNIQIAIDALLTAQLPHDFLGISPQGQIAILKSRGNPNGHIILRGALDHTNYEAASIDSACGRLTTHGLSPRLMVDCSHGNCQKHYQQQIKVAEHVCDQITHGSSSIFGLMLESHLIAGKQIMTGQSLVYGQSITDACIAWQETEKVIEKLAYAVRTRANKKRSAMA